LAWGALVLDRGGFDSFHLVRHDRPQESLCSVEDTTVFFSKEQGLHTKHRKGGEGVFLEGVAVLMEDKNSPRA